MRIYTKRGDDGSTTLRDSPMNKDDPLLDLLGNLDELNSHLGLLHTVKNKEIKGIVFDLQDDLFSIGAEISGNNSKLNLEKKTKDLETYIDELSDEMPSLKNFILPGGSDHAARLHLTRAVARRLERSAVKLRNKRSYEDIPIQGLIRYLNRISDLLFVMARYVNFKLGVEDTIWPDRT